LHASLPHIRMNSLAETDRYEGPVLLVRGEKSNFIADGDAGEMRRWFPHLEEATVKNAGHNVHVEKRTDFLNVLTWW
jgi:pimeloyl-ACP methyl ester carboxylesterase